VLKRISIHAIVIGFLVHGNSSGQDLHYSQFSQAAQQLNPSLSGVMPCDLRVASFARQQWSSVTIPYRTFTAGAAMKLDVFSEKLNGFSTGILAAYDDAGDGQMRSLDFRLSAAYSFAVSPDSSHRVNFGFMGGFSSRSIDFGKLTFDNQFNGDIFDPLSPPGETWGGNNRSWSDLGAGISWSHRHSTREIVIGLSAQHLNRPEQQFLTATEKRPVLWQAGGYASLDLGSGLLLLPAGQVLLQREYREYMLGTEFKSILQLSAARFSAIGFGIWYRSADAIIPSFALYKNKFRYGVSYDINISPLKTVSRGAGGPEFSLVYQWSKIKPLPNPKGICPVY